MTRCLFLLLIITALAFYLLASGTPVQAQAPTPIPDSPVIAEIKQYAERHVQNNAGLSTALVVELFRDNTEGLTPNDIARIYEEEYIRLNQASSLGLLEQLGSKAAWIGLVLLALGIIVRTVMKSWTDILLRKSGELISSRLGGSRLYRRWDLRHYWAALIERYESIDISFRPDRPLAMRNVYVPLRVAGIGEGGEIDSNTAVGRYRRLMVTGSPGSGKSMLLRHIALSYAEDRLTDLPGQPIPVVVELHRLNSRDHSVTEHVVAALGRSRFKNAEGFVHRNLEQGKLLILFDGLDEVSTAERDRVAREVNNFLDENWKCRAIITCRTLVYRGEFDAVADGRLEIVDFSDLQIRSFMRSWADDMPEDKSVDQLIQTLHDRPRIMALARNPLLLTIIAHLYTDTPHVLPHSRSEFYDLSTDVLLRQLHHERNEYPAPAKRLVLQHLALFNQDRMDQSEQDRRSMDYQSVLAQVKTVLPSLDREPEKDAEPILKEIEERSGLFLAIDGGQRYQFAHLTLQEFFAAAQLKNEPDTLISRLTADRDAWRETVKLWCGLVGDSTDFIKLVHKIDNITGFECLADAQQVDVDVANDILEEFKEHLGESGEDDPIVEAFGSVASVPGARGDSAYDFLQTTLVESEDPDRRRAAANALSRTNLPRATILLSTLYAERTEVRGPLIRMGDLAVPALARLAAAGSDDALGNLQDIGTPQAIEALVELLWNPDEDIASNAAWRLAAILPHSYVEETLRGYDQLTVEQRRSDNLNWVWEPFGEAEGSSLTAIAGRVAYLMVHSKLEVAPMEAQQLDPRLVIPLAAIEALDREALQKLEGIYIPDFPNWDSGLKTFLDDSEPSPIWRRLAMGLSASMFSSLVGRLKGSRLPNQNDWRDVFRPAQYETLVRWLDLATGLVTIGVSGIALFQIALTIIPVPELQILIPVIVAGLVLLYACGVTIWLENDLFSGAASGNDWELIYRIVWVGPIGVPHFMLGEDFLEEDTSGRVAMLVLVGPFALWLPTIGYFVSILLLHQVDIPYVVGIWMIVAVAVGSLGYCTRYFRRRFDNPLKSLLRSVEENLGEGAVEGRLHSILETATP